MSGRWKKAADLTVLYSEGRGNGTASNMVTRAVLRELCWISHDVGIVQASVATIAQRLGIAERSVQRALARLQDDRVIVRAIRGNSGGGWNNGNASVYVIRRLPDARGDYHPDPEWINHRWRVAWLASPRWQKIKRKNQRIIREIWSGRADDEHSAEMLAESPQTISLPIPLVAEVTTEEVSLPDSHDVATGQRCHPCTSKRQLRAVGPSTESPAKPNPQLLRVSLDARAAAKRLREIPDDEFW